jgi:hypothetical protein
MQEQFNVSVISCEGVTILLFAKACVNVKFNAAIQTMPANPKSSDRLNCLSAIPIRSATEYLSIKTTLLKVSCDLNCEKHSELLTDGRGVTFSIFHKLLK